MATIVIIDDEPAVRAVAAHFLKNAGHTVTTAEDGKAGATLIRSSGAQLVITDLVMPEMEGIETIIHVRREFPGLKIVAMSGAGRSPLYFQAALLLGAHACLDKPFGADALLAAVDTALKDESPGQTRAIEWKLEESIHPATRQTAPMNPLPPPARTKQVSGYQAHVE
jgi:DNA-binding NtrC family response regulator